MGKKDKLFCSTVCLVNFKQNEVNSLSTVVILIKLLVNPDVFYFVDGQIGPLTSTKVILSSIIYQRRFFNLNVSQYCFFSDDVELSTRLG